MLECRKWLCLRHVCLRSCLSGETLKDPPLQLALRWSAPNIRTGLSTPDLSSQCSSGDSHGQSEDFSQQISRQYPSPRLDTPSLSLCYSRFSGKEKDLSKSIDHGFQPSS